MNKQCERCYLWCRESVQNAYPAAPTNANFVLVDEGNSHWLLMPKAANRGIEDAAKIGGDAVFDTAWAEGMRLFRAPENIAMGVNPTRERTQHQYHMHIAQPSKDLRALLDGNKQKFGKFTPIDSALAPKFDFSSTWCNSKQSGDKKWGMTVKWVDTPIGKPSAATPFEAANNLCSTLPNASAPPTDKCTVLVVGPSATDKADPNVMGYYLVVTSNTCVEALLNVPQKS